MRIKLEDFDAEKCSRTWRLRAAGIANSIFGRKDASVLSINQCEILVLAERKVAVDWGRIARGAVLRELDFATKTQNSGQQHSTALGTWVTSFVRRKFEVLLEGKPTFTLPTVPTLQV